MLIYVGLDRDRPYRLKHVSSKVEFQKLEQKGNYIIITLQL